MKTFSIIAVALASVLAAGTAAAESPMPDQYPVAAQASSTTRAQVQSELAKARADGSMKVWSTQYNPFAAMRGSKTRDEVRAELMAARATGEIEAFTGEDSGSSYLARATTPAHDAGTRLAGTPRAAQ